MNYQYIMLTKKYTKNLRDDAETMLSLLPQAVINVIMSSEYISVIVLLQLS